MAYVVMSASPGVTYINHGNNILFSVMHIFFLLFFGGVVCIVSIYYNCLMLIIILFLFGSVHLPLFILSAIFIP